VGGFVLAIGSALVLLDLLLHFRLGRRVRTNPWHADTLEWAIRMPPSPYNFVSLPDCPTRHPLWERPDLPREIAEGRHALSTTDHGRRETWGSDPLTGQVREVIHLPGNSWWPLCAALALAITCVALLVRTYTVAALAATVAIVLLLRWSWENGAHPRAAPDAAVQPGDPPLHSRTFDGPGLWGMGITLIANGALYLALLFGWFYLWTVAPGWKAPGEPPLAPGMMLITGLILSLAGPGIHRLLRTLRADHDGRLELRLWGIAVLGIIHLAALLWLTTTAKLAPAASAHDAVFTVALIYLVIHSGLAAIMTTLQALRVRVGYVGRLAPYELAVVAQWWWYTIIVYWTTFLALLVFPMTWGAV
jgi:cytochrome c oxidase subunit I+III